MIYRLSMTIDDEVEAEDEYKAWGFFMWRFQERYYGPTREHVEEAGQAPEEELGAEE